jgi:hypothetical protein
MEQMNQKYTIKDFLPVIIIFSSVLLLSIITAHWTSNWNWAGLMRYFMAYFFIIFGAFKIINLPGFVEAYMTYDLIAQKSILYAYGYPFIEITLGIFYLMNWVPTITNIVTLIVMLVSAAGVYNELRKNKMIACACLGVVFKIPMTYITLFEDLLMAGMAAIMLLA